MDHSKTSTMKNVLEFDSLELTFGDRKILSSIYMKCEQGEIVGLLGRNGSGKSSLMKVVFGALQAEHMSLRMNGEPLVGNYNRKRVIAYLPQDDLIPSYISLRLAFKLFKIDIAKIIKIFPQISDFIDLNPSEVSGGFRRLIETLLILHSPSPFCILDEPFTGLMPVHIETLKTIILESKINKGIIVSDHMHRHVTELSDRLYLLANGTTRTIKQKEQLVDLGYLSSV
jgi:ABC-type multidrug transport system ATPase subunit